MPPCSSRHWVLIGVWLLTLATCLGGLRVVNEDIGVDVDDEFQDLFVDRRSPNAFQSSSLEGKTKTVT